MSLEEDYRSLKRLHESTVLVVDDLQKKYNELLEENNILLQKLINAQGAVDISKEIMRNALIEQNRIKDEYVNEINLLKEKIKQLSK